MERLKQERARWRTQHPHLFSAKPELDADGTLNLFKWNAEVPGVLGSSLDGALIPVKLVFPEDFPTSGPRAYTTPPMFHPNVYPSGEICCSFISADWLPSSSIADVLGALQLVLSCPNPLSPANIDAYMMFVNERDEYDKTMQVYACKNSIRERLDIKLLSESDVRESIIGERSSMMLGSFNAPITILS